MLVQTVRNEMEFSLTYLPWWYGDALYSGQGSMQDGLAVPVAISKVVRPVDSPKLER